MATSPPLPVDSDVFKNLFRNAIDHNDPPVTVTVGQFDESWSNGGPFMGRFLIEDGGDGGFTVSG